MPTKPSAEVINACKVKLDPKDVLRTIINETPELRQPMIDAGLIQEKEE